VKVALPLGDIVDRISILCIKAARFRDASQVANVNAELLSLRQSWALAAYPAVSDLPQWDELHRVNQSLWEVEDALRACEKEGCFDDRFVQMARSVYQLNDRRAALKRSINLSLDSKLMVEKGHHHE
jgi:hypothetical protein